MTASDPKLPISDDSTPTTAAHANPTATTLPVPRSSSSSSSVPVHTGTEIAGLMPRTIEEFWKLAKYAAESEIVPKDFRGKPYNTLIAMELALELGVPWMQGLQGMAVINGRPGPYGDLQLAIVMNSPLYEDHDEFYLVKNERRESLTADDWKHSDTAAVCTCIRHGKRTPVTRIFSVEQAKKAGLLAKPGPWQEYPDRQLRMRARGFALRDCFPDVLKGLSHSVEELRDTPPEPVVLEASTRAIRRRSDTLHDFTDREPVTRQDADPDPAA